MAQHVEQTIKIKIFRTLQKNFDFLGITSFQSTQKSPFNSRNSISLLLHGIFVVSAIMYVLCDAYSFVEYTNGINNTLSLIVTTASFVIVIWIMEKWFKFIDHLERIVFESE